ncbi:MAG: DNA polymerase subunit beta, partial [Candidatus Bathyarchaeia archaeon]
VVGRESYVAGLLGISPRTVMDRVRALGKRSRVGRTGLFIERELGPEENFESALAELEAGNPALRRRLRSPRSI